MSKIKNTDKAQILNLYYQKLDSLGLEFELQTVETTFGDTNVIVLENNKKPPLILVHGFLSCAPFALENLKGLEKYFKIYAIDVLGEHNLSDAFYLNPTNKDYSNWFYEVLSRLQVYNAYFVGISLGGFIGFKTLVANSKRFKKAFFINPTGVVNFNILKVATHLLVPLLLYNKLQKEKYLRKVFHRLSYKKDALLYNFVSKKILISKASSYYFPLISKPEAIQIQTPLYIIASEDGLIYGGKALIQKAKKHFPSLKEVIFLKDAKHILTIKENEIVINYILEKTNTKR